MNGLSPELTKLLENRLREMFPIGSNLEFVGRITDGSWIKGKVVKVDFPFVIVSSDYGQFSLYEHEIKKKPL